MRQFFEAAFYPPPRGSDGFDSTRFAVLPQNTSGELSHSEVHTQLDRALFFLQREVGYVLLDDARPNPGGGVQLRPLQKNILAIPKGERSTKVPKEEPGRRTPKSDSPDEHGGLVLADGIIVRLRTILERKDGELLPSELVEAIHRRGQNPEGGNAKLEKVFRDIGIDDQDHDITWQQFEALLHAYCKAKGVSEQAVESVEDFVRQVLEEGSAISPASSSSMLRALPDPDLPSINHLAKYAHHNCDLVLVARFAHILSKTVSEDLEKQEGMSPAAAKSCIETAVKHDGLYKCVLQGVRLMHLCDYDYADVVLVLAYASVYFRSTFGSIGKKMSPNEAAHVVVLLIYLAHAFLLDETCPLRIWQKHIFRKYCTLKVLDAALFRLFQMRPSFKLNIKYEEERVALWGLSGLQWYPDEAEKANPISPLKNVNLTHPKPKDGKDHVKADNGNGCEREPASTASRENDRPNHHVNGKTSPVEKTVC